jgi:hypothetical protein
VKLMAVANNNKAANSSVDMAAVYDCRPTQSQYTSPSHTVFCIGRLAST